MYNGVDGPHRRRCCRIVWISLALKLAELMSETIIAVVQDYLAVVEDYHSRIASSAEGKLAAQTLSPRQRLRIRITSLVMVLEAHVDALAASRTRVVQCLIMSGR